MEAEFWGESDVDDKIKFVRKVYAILTCQLILTAILIGMCNSSEGAKKWCKDNAWLYIFCFIGWIGAMCTLVCTKYDTIVPHNYILLAIFTICFGYSIAGTTTRYDTSLIVTAGVGTKGSRYLSGRSQRGVAVTGSRRPSFAYIRSIPTFRARTVRFRSCWSLRVWYAR